MTNYYYCPGCGGVCANPTTVGEQMRCMMHLGAGALKAYPSPDHMPVPYHIRESYVNRIMEQENDVVALCKELLMEKLEMIPPEQLREEIAYDYPELVEWTNEETL